MFRRSPYIPPEAEKFWTLRLTFTHFWHLSVPLTAHTESYRQSDTHGRAPARLLRLVEARTPNSAHNVPSHRAQYPLLYIRCPRRSAAVPREEVPLVLVCSLAPRSFHVLPFSPHLSHTPIRNAGISSCQPTGPTYDPRRPEVAPTLLGGRGTSVEARGGRAVYSSYSAI